MLLSGWRCRPVFLSLDCWSCSVKLLSCLRGCKLEPSFKDSLCFSRSLFSAWIFKNISLWNPSGWPCKPNPPNVLPPLWSPDIPPCLHTTSQRQNGPNYHFNLGLLSADDLPAPHCVNPPQVFQSSQQTLTMEGHHPSHDLFHQILLHRLWKNLNQEVHLCHLPHLLSQSFCLSCPVDDEGILPVTHH